jgi:gluconate 2-dehydrogenase gamma chain
LVPTVRRREFLIFSAASIGGVLVYSLDRKPVRASADDHEIRIPLRFFTRQEALAVAALASRIFPSDDSSPGARDAGVVVYIDRQLAGPYGRDRHRYTGQPFENGAREFGYQGHAAPREIYRQGIKPLLGIDRRGAAEQDEALRKIESTYFFELLRAHTIEGMFCDPIHGGNADMIGWQMIGFPGPRMSNSDDIDQHYGEAFRPKPTNLREIGGDRVRPAEDEK